MFHKVLLLLTINTRDCCNSTIKVSSYIIIKLKMKKLDCTNIKAWDEQIKKLRFTNKTELYKYKA